MGYAASIAKRHTPDPSQAQIVLGAMLGRGRLVADSDGVRLVVTLHARHAWLAQWTYERIAPLAPMPRRSRDRIVLRSEAHPLFADLAASLRRPRRLLTVVHDEALWVWAMYARVSGCERNVVDWCECAPATPLPRTLLRAS